MNAPIDRSPSKPLGGARVLAIVVAAVLALVGLGIGAGGATLIWAHTTQRDRAGFYTTHPQGFTTNAYALTARVDLGEVPGQRDWTVDHPVGTVRLVVNTTTATPVFVGVGPTSAVEAWLKGVAHDEVTGANFGPFTTTMARSSGELAPAMPATQLFWAASQSGVGAQTLLWPSAQGDWTIVVANANAQRDVTVDVSVGARTNALLPIGIVAAGIGLVLLLGGGLLIFTALRGRATPATDAVRRRSPGTYPVRLDGRLDQPLSRWLWLVKFVLIVPHAIVLAFLWLAVTVMTVVAGFAIVFTGRYPRSIFDFNVGVMRWTWRVGFYATSAFGTDRYPPFTLERDPTYPADLTIAYPEHLSRWLVLVKWWLLALPHLIIVAILTGGFGSGTSGGWRIASGGGIITLLAFVGAVVLAVRGRYPQRLFDVTMGLNRWCFRVLAYVALMTDEYPPFRLDTGGTDPGSELPPPPPPAPPATPDTPRDLVDAHR